MQAHWEALAAANFFTVEVWTRSGLVRVMVLFVIELSTRRVEIASNAERRTHERKEEGWGLNHEKSDLCPIFVPDGCSFEGG